MRKILAAAGALSAAAVITGSSLPAASAAAHHTTAKMESFRLVSGVVSGRGSVVATGAFTAGGSTNLNTPVGVLHFPHGSVKAFPHATSTVTQVSRRTCLMTIVQHGTYRLGGAPAGTLISPVMARTSPIFWPCSTGIKRAGARSPSGRRRCSRSSTHTGRCPASNRVLPGLVSGCVAALAWDGQGIHRHRAVRAADQRVDV